MNKLLYALIFITLSAHCYAEDIHLDLQNKNDFVIVSVENFSPKDVRVSKLFTQNPAFGLITVNLWVNGRIVGFKSPPNENFPSESDYLTLRPFDIMGRIFPIADIRRSYGITAKCFLMSVTYHDVMAKKYMAYASTIKSKQITICR
ncbi:MAG TPA: hypothetical protein VNZ27_07275 [Rhodanobacter sp.]|jgi:hypothetical protein|nr:hypothetical protein [Rhodanobacter sp.]